MLDGWRETLVWASGPGVQVVVGALWSWLAEAIPGWSRWPRAARRGVMMALCLSVPLIARAILAWAGEPTSPEDWVEAIEAGFAAYFGSQVGHLRMLVRRD